MTPHGGAAPKEQPDHAGGGPHPQGPPQFLRLRPTVESQFSVPPHTGDSPDRQAPQVGGPLFTFSGFYDNLIILKCPGVFIQKKILFYERLYHFRKQAGISQKQLGEVIGLSNKAICTMENGTRETTFEKLALLAEYFHVSTDYLLGVTDTPTPKE